MRSGNVTFLQINDTHGYIDPTRNSFGAVMKQSIRP